MKIVPNFAQHFHFGGTNILTKMRQKLPFSSQIAFVTIFCEYGRVRWVKLKYEVEITGVVFYD